MTGAWPELSDGPAMNPLAGQTSRTWTQDNLMAAAHRAGLTTAYAGTDWFPQLFQPGTVDHLAPVHEETDAADEASTVALLGFLAADQGDLLLLHLNEVDHAGHRAGGPRDPALGRGRDQGRRPDRPGRGGPGPQRDTVVVVRTMAMSMPAVTVVRTRSSSRSRSSSGAGIRPGSYGDHDQVDVAPTVATLLGTNLPRSTRVTRWSTFSPALGISPLPRRSSKLSCSSGMPPRSERPRPRSRRSQIRYRHTRKHCPTFGAVR